jgi:hypothetical protein
MELAMREYLELNYKLQFDYSFLAAQPKSRRAKKSVNQKKYRSRAFARMDRICGI